MFRHSGFGFFSSLCCLLFFILFSCKKKNDSFALDFQYEYAPVNSDHYVVYDVDSITYKYITPIAFIDSSHYQLKELVADTFYDGLNELNYELELYRRANEDSLWEFDRKWSVKRTSTTFQKKEDDINFIKLVFPPEPGLEWNGNIYVSVTDLYRVFRNWNYNYTEVHAPYSVNNLNFDSTITVSEVNDTFNVIERTIRQEIYAKQVGMIYQQWEYLKKENIGGNWQTGDLTGFRIQMKVREYN